MKPIVVAENLSKTYFTGPGIGVEVLRGASLSVRRGGFVAITGRSGSGKSTLLHILGALDRPTGGRVLCDGRNLFDLPVAARDRLRCTTFGFVFQFYHLLPELHVLENTMLPVMVRMPVVEWLRRRREVRERCVSVLERVGLKARLHHRPNQLSGGEQQRVAIARALANQPAVLLADEPTGNLDSGTGQEVLRLLRELHRGGQAIVMVTHNAEIARMAERVLQLEDGKLTAAV